MRASHVVEHKDGTWTDTASLSYGIRHTNVPREIYFKSTSGPFNESSDHLIPLTLLMTMVTGESLDIEGSVSPQFMANVPKIQAILQAFTRVHHQDIPAIDVSVSSQAVQELPEGRGRALFFSGGVDSTFSAIRDRDKLDALVFIHGFDLDVRDEEWRRLAAQRVRSSAAAIGLPLIEIETTMSRFMGRASSWRVAYGPALATIALLLQPLFREMNFSSGRAYTRLGATGSHPMLDPLWSTESMEIVHNGGDMERWQKIAYLADNPIAQQHLRICFERKSAPYNCGECGKCTTTMITLAALGALDKFDVFAKPLDFDHISRMDLSDEALRHRIEDSLRILDGPDGKPFPELRRALVRSLEGWVESLREPVTTRTSPAE